jgi:hypothetical protein
METQNKIMELFLRAPDGIELAASVFRDHRVLISGQDDE